MPLTSPLIQCKLYGNVIFIFKQDSLAENSTTLGKAWTNSLAKSNSRRVYV